MASRKDVERSVSILFNFFHTLNAKKIVFNGESLSLDLFCYLVKFMTQGYEDNKSFAKSMNVTESASTQCLNKLVELGLLLKNVDPEDKRKKIYKETIFAKVLYDNYILSLNDSILEDMNEEINYKLSKYLDTLLENINQIKNQHTASK